MTSAVRKGFSSILRRCFVNKTEIFHRTLVVHSALEGRKTDLVIFDKNGTLIDFGAAWTPWVVDLNRRISANLKKPLGDTVFAALGFDVIGRSWRLGKIMGSEEQMKESIVQALVRQNITESNAVEVVDKSFIHCDFTNPDYIKPIDHPRAMMQTLQDYGVKVAIATTDMRIGTELVIDTLGLWPVLDASICCGEDHGTQPKPDPINIKIICDRLGVPPERTCVIGDTTGDIEMGKNADCQMTVGVLCGVGLRPELDSTQPDLILPSTVDVLQYVLPDGFLHVYSKHVTNLPLISDEYAKAWQEKHPGKSFS